MVEGHAYSYERIENLHIWQDVTVLFSCGAQDQKGTLRFNCTVGDILYETGDAVGVAEGIGDETDADVRHLAGHAAAG